MVEVLSKLLVDVGLYLPPDVSNLVIKNSHALQVRSLQLIVIINLLSLSCAFLLLLLLLLFLFIF